MRQGDQRNMRKVELERRFTPKRGRTARVREGNSLESKGSFWREPRGGKKYRGILFRQGIVFTETPGPAGNIPTPSRWSRWSCANGRRKGSLDAPA